MFIKEFAFKWYVKITDLLVLREKLLNWLPKIHLCVQVFRIFESNVWCPEYGWSGLVWDEAPGTPSSPPTQPQQSTHIKKHFHFRGYCFHMFFSPDKLTMILKHNAYHMTCLKLPFCGTNRYYILKVWITIF